MGLHYGTEITPRTDLESWHRRQKWWFRRHKINGCAICNFFHDSEFSKYREKRFGYPYPYPVPVWKQFLDIRIQLQTHYPAGYPIVKPDSDHLFANKQSVWLKFIASSCFYFTTQQITKGPKPPDTDSTRRGYLSLLPSSHKLKRPSNSCSPESLSGIPLLGNLSLDWEFQQRLGKNLGVEVSRELLGKLHFVG